MAFAFSSSTKAKGEGSTPAFEEGKRAEEVGLLDRGGEKNKAEKEHWPSPAPLAFHSCGEFTLRQLKSQTTIQNER